MSDFDDLRGILGEDEEDDDFSDISFDDIVDDEDFAYGQEIGSTDEFAPIDDTPGPVNQFLNQLTPQQRLIVSVMLFANVLVLSIGMLVATGRIG